MLLSPGTRLGPYEIVIALGAGGMGEVYRATDTSLGREVAVKVLPDAFAEEPERLARFEREARTLASAIIGILAAIAIPQFSAYRTRSYNSAAEADLRNAATAQEAYYVGNQLYLASPTNLIGATYGFYTSAGVVVPAGSAASQGYTMTSYHTSGNKTFTLAGPGGSVTSN